MISLLRNQAFHAVEYKGKTFDCGDKVGFVLANLAFGLSRKDMTMDLHKGIIDLLNEHMQSVHTGLKKLPDGKKAA